MRSHLLRLLTWVCSLLLLDTMLYAGCIALSFRHRPEFSLQSAARQGKLMPLHTLVITDAHTSVIAFSRPVMAGRQGKLMVARDAHKAVARLRTHPDSFYLARSVLFGRAARRRFSGSGRKAAPKIRRLVTPEEAAEASQPWLHHPLALLGFYKQYIPADGDGHDMPAAPAGVGNKKPPLASHVAVRYRDGAPDTLNPGWEPTVWGLRPPFFFFLICSRSPAACQRVFLTWAALSPLCSGSRLPVCDQVHTFQVPAPAAAKLNAALGPEMRALAESEKGLRVSNRGGGFHSKQQLFQRCGVFWM